MAFNVDIQVTGAAQLNRALKKLSDQSAKKVAKKMVSKGTTIVAKHARRNVRAATSSKELGKLVGKQTKKSRRDGYWGRVYIKESKSGRKIVVDGREVDISVALHFLEFGTVGGIREHAMLRKARTQAEPQANHTMLKTGEEELRKLGRSAGLAVD